MIYVNRVLVNRVRAIQNAAVRLIFELGLREHVTPGLLQLHWLPVRWRIQNKLCAIMQSIHSEMPNLPERYCSNSRQQFVAFRPVVIYKQYLRHPTVAY